MRFWDKTNIALRSIINNKSRSILTIIIIFIVSSLILSIMMIALNFSTNSYKISEISVRKSSSYFNAYRYEEDRYNSVASRFSKEETMAIVDVIKENTFIFNDFSLDNYNEQHYFIPMENKQLTFPEFNKLQFYEHYTEQKITSFYIPFGVPNAVIAGRIWNENDVNTNNIWVTDVFINKAYQNGLLLEVGSKIWINTYTTDYETNEYRFTSIEYQIAGILSVDNIKAYSDALKEQYPHLYYSINTNVEIYCDISFLANTADAFPHFSSFSMSYLPPTSTYDFNQLYENVENAYNQLKEITKTTKPVQTNIYSTIIEEFKMIRIINAFIIGLAIGLGLFVLFLSIGSVANTIIISVDKNKKFIGLTKALGLKQKEVEDIVRIEATITIILGIILATIGLLIAINFFNYINTSLINSAFAYQLKELDYTIKTTIPIYLPISVGIVFVVMTLLFSKGSLQTISKMDVITIISEVS